jgi:hypothetical protein
MICAWLAVLLSQAERGENGSETHICVVDQAHKQQMFLLSVQAGQVSGCSSVIHTCSCVIIISSA